MKTLVHWTRLEPRARSNDFGPSLRAEVRDPAWMLCRQWQLGELGGHDGGSPSRLDAEVDVFRLADAGLDAPPLEARVEREAFAFDGRARAEAGLAFLRFLRREGAGHRKGTFLAVAPLAATTPFSEALAPRVPDGGTLLDALDAGRALWELALPDGSPLPPELRIDDPGERSKVDAAGVALVAWRNAVYGPPTIGDAPGWRPHALAYDLGVALEGGAADVLVADKNGTGSIDWADFDLAAPLPAPTVEPLRAGGLPAAVTFPGMAASRFWEMEDARVDFGAMAVPVADVGRLLLVEFALVAGDDWSWLPLRVPSGSLLRVRRLAVQDSFGVTWNAPPAGRGTGFRLFDLDGVDAGAPVLLVPPTVPVTTAPPIEEVVFFTDEAANLAWAVERTLPGPLGEPTSGRAASPPRPPRPQTEEIAYELVSNVAEHWIPFQAVRREGTRRKVALERAALLRARPDGSLEPIAPRGRVLTPADVVYRIDEEAIGRVPVAVQRSWQRARTTSGRTFLWLGRRTIPTRPDGPSGLAFDQLVEET